MIAGKANVLCVLKILEKYSDENHILPMRDLLKKIDFEYGVRLDRRSVYSAIGLLMDFGYDISVYEENRKGYYLRSRTFEEAEARLLVDSILRSAFLPEKHTADLIEKIQSDLSVHQRKKYKHITANRSQNKTPNSEVFYNIELLGEAIDNRKQVKFTYLAYDLDKKLKPRRNEKYTVNPYGMICDNERYYLVCSYDGYTELSHYRIDRIKSAEIIDKATEVLPKGFDLQSYADNAVYAFGSKPEMIIL